MRGPVVFVDSLSAVCGHNKRRIWKERTFGKGVVRGDSRPDTSRTKLLDTGMPLA